jgi:hypothetical protein
MTIGTVVTTSILNTVAAMGLATLRQQIQLVKRCNREYESEINAAKPGSTVNIVVPAAVSAAAVSPSYVPPGSAQVTPSYVPITLNKWYRAPFAFDEKQLHQVDRGIIPMQINEAIKGLVNQIENDVWAVAYKKFYTAVGTAGTTPYGSDVKEFLDADKAANDNIMPIGDRFLINSTAAHANWIGLRRTYDTSFQRLDIDECWSQLVPTHTAGTYGETDKGTGATGYQLNGVHTLGATTLTVKGGTLGTILEGDVIAIAGSAQQYVATADGSTGTTVTSVTISPALVVGFSGNDAIAVQGDHTVNLLAHPQSIAFAMAPMTEGLQLPQGMGAIMQQTAVDQDSGLALRLVVSHQFYQMEWSFDALYGAAVPRPSLGVRIMG